jgi:hypothetical protein
MHIFLCMSIKIQIRIKMKVGYHETSVADPDPDGSTFILVNWIRIRIGNTDPDSGGPKLPTKQK